MNIKKEEFEKLRQAIQNAETTAANLRASNAALTEKLATAEKELASDKSTESYRSTQLTEAHAELEQLHSLLDVFPGCLARESEEKESYKRTQYKAMTRLASWLAGRGTLAVTLSPKSEG
jgi:hypothetical protein